MTDSVVAPPGPGGRMMAGGIRILLAESLLIPSGLLTAAYLARMLGPDGYGIFMVAAALVAWVEWGLTGVFARASVRFVAEAVDWRPIGSTIASAHLALATVAAVLLAALADVIARLLDTPGLAAPLRLFALDIPLFGLAQAHRSILVGIGDFESRALAAATRWVSRLLLVVLFVHLGLSVQGAVLGSIGASLVEVAVCRRYVRPALSFRAAGRVGQLWSVVAPLLVSALALRFFDRLDLVALMALGGTPAQAGHYGAAQNLSILPTLVGLSFAPLLLATLTRSFSRGDHAEARRVGSAALRWVALLLPFAALGAGASRGIVGLLFGPAFAPTAPLIAPLIFAALALVTIGATTAMLTAAGRLGLTAAFTAPLPVVAGLAYLAVIPRYGMRGAALVTLLVSTGAALSLCVAVFRVCRMQAPLATLVRSAVVGAAAYGAAMLWAADGAAVLVELGVLGLGAVIALAGLGEFTRAELGAVRSWWGPNRRPAT
jgi:O-antigen/teichoic acid export membrane protein